jgi:hypothetical protein
MTWQKCNTFVFGVMAASKRLVNSSCDVAGAGSEIFVSLIPSRRTRCSQVSSMRG